MTRYTMSQLGRALLVCGVVFFGWTVAAKADYIVGPGNIATTNPDGISPNITLDRSNPMTLTAAGDYVAQQFNYEITAFQEPSDPTTDVTFQGILTPFLAKQDGSNYVVVAVGSDIAINTTHADWQAATFGGTNTFTVAANTEVYAGFYWHSGGGYAPIGWMTDAANGLADVTFNQSLPAIGGNLPSAQYPNLTRLYDFSVSVAPVPEPCSLIMILGAGIGLLAYAWRKRR